MILKTNSNLQKQDKSISKTIMANDLGISRQLLYYQPKLPQKDSLLCDRIKEVMNKHKSYGYRRIAIELGVNHKRILRVMKFFNLKIKRSPKMPIKRKNKDFCAVENFTNLLTNLEINRPNQVWSADFTYLPFFGRFYYLATVIDAYTREIIGHSIGARHNTELVCQSLLDALKTRRNITPQIFHSDQGSEYRSKDFTKLLIERNIKISMSKKASPWQNGRQESLYGKFKLELGHPEIYRNIGELVEAIELQIYYYNNERIHSVFKCPPRVFYKSEMELAANTYSNKRQKKSPDMWGLLSFFGLHFSWLQEKIFYKK